MREDREPEWVRRRRRERVFGDVLPDTTGDEKAPEDRTETTDDWLRAQVPPHHGG